MINGSLELNPSSLRGDLPFSLMAYQAGSSLVVEGFVRVTLSHPSSSCLRLTCSNLPLMMHNKMGWLTCPSPTTAKWTTRLFSTLMTQFFSCPPALIKRWLLRTSSQTMPNPLACRSTFISQHSFPLTWTMIWPHKLPRSLSARLVPCLSHTSVFLWALLIPQSKISCRSSVLLRGVLPPHFLSCHMQGNCPYLTRQSHPSSSMQCALFIFHQSLLKCLIKSEGDTYGSRKLSKATNVTLWPPGIWCVNPKT